MSSAGRRRRIGALLAGVLITAASAGCSSDSSGSSPGPAESPTTAAISGSGVPSPPDDLLAALASAGIGVVDDLAGPAGARLHEVDGAEAFVIGAWQANVLAAEVAASSGFSAEALDALAPIPDIAPMSAVLAGWMDAEGDDAATSAAALMGDPDWEGYQDQRYPMAVVLMFTADLVRHADEPDDGSGAGPSRIVHPEATGLHCGNISAIVDDLLTQITSKLQLDPAKVAGFVGGQVDGFPGVVLGTVAGFLAGFWNHTVGLAQKALVTAVQTVTAPVVDAIRTAIGGLAVVSAVASYLKPWSMTMKPAPSHLALGTAAQSGTVKASVDPKAVVSQWPDFLVDCAADYQVQLPALSSKGLPVQWTVDTGSGLLSLTSPNTTTLDDQLATTAEFETATETPEQAKGDLVTDLVWFNTNAQRTEVEQLRELAVKLVGQEIPLLLRGLAQPILESFSNEIADRVRDIVGVKGSTYVAVDHHVPSECGPAIPAGHYTATFDLEWEQTTTVTALGQTIPATERFSGTATLDLTSDGETVSGTFTLTGTNEGEAGGTFGSTNGPFTFTIGGTAAEPAATFTVPPNTPLAGVQFTADLHLTKVNCSEIAGNAFEMVRELILQTPALAPAGTSIRIDSVRGSGTWTAARQ